MYQILYKWRLIRRIVAVSSFGLFSVSCAIGHFDHGQPVQPGYGHQSGASGYQGLPDRGLAVGAVVSADGRDALKPYLRWRYADQLASHILYTHPHMQGQVDSYEYVSRRVRSFDSLLKRYRQQGDLDGEALRTLREAELRRRYLMMVSILPGEESIELPPDLDPVVGHLNEKVDDYYDMRYHTIRLMTVRVQIFDTAAGQKIFDDVFSSNDGGVALASERRTRKYVGNSLVAALSNSASNGFRHTEYPPAPKIDVVFDRLWQRVAQALPGGL